MDLFEHEASYETDGDALLKQQWSPISAPTSVSENDSSCLECNICLDSANEPMVTLCGHLYCWPCIYKWLHVETSSLDADEIQKNCPVCKANISITSLVPLYGCGTSSSGSESEKPNLGGAVPRRPHPSVLNTSVTSGTSPTRHRTQQSRPDFFPSQAESFYNPGPAPMVFSSLGGLAIVSFFNLLMGMFGGMPLEWYPFNRRLVSNNPRIRRQEREWDKSLNRVSVFLTCCVILSLLLF